MNYYIFALAWRITKFLPYKVARSIFAQLAKISYRRNSRSIQQLRKNLSVVTKLSGDDLEDLVVKALVSYSRYWCEAFQLPNYSNYRIGEMVRISNSRQLLDPLKNGQGVLVAVPHLGNWDLAGRWFAIHAGEVFTVAERLKPEKLFDAFLRYRKSIGLIAYPAKDRATVTALKQHLEQGKLVALVADRDMSASGIEVIFCGEKCTMPAGPATLAYATKSILTTACLYNEPDHLAGYVELPIEIDYSIPKDEAIKLATQQMADRFSNYVTNHPTDWHVLQKVWGVHA